MISWEGNSPTSPEGDGDPEGAVSGGEVVRPVGFPPGTSAVPPLWSRDPWRRRWACRRLDRLARELRRCGWATETRYGQFPPVLHVFSANAPSVGESVTVVRGITEWWYQSSTGAWLGTCREAWRAAESVTELLKLWGITPGWSGEES